MSDEQAELVSRPTMRDVAALAGVAIKTVSRVMNDEPTVAPELAQRVRVAATRLGYRPNLAASSLRRLGGRTATVGLLLDDVANPFSAALLRAVEDAARERRVHVLIGSLDHDPDRERELARTLIDRRVDGLIIVPAVGDQSYLLVERASGTRVVFLDREPRLLAADAVISDNRHGARSAVAHLVSAGHTRIAYVGDRPDIATADQRFTGYREVLREQNLPIDEHLIRDDLRTVDAAVRAVGDLLATPDPPTAIFASQNLVTIGATKALHAAHRETTTALVGFDDFPLAEVLNPGITVIAQDPGALGRRAAEILFARLDGDESPIATHVIATRLIQRGSGEVPRHDRPVDAVAPGRA